MPTPKKVAKPAANINISKTHKQKTPLISYHPSHPHKQRKKEEAVSVVMSVAENHIISYLIMMTGEKEKHNSLF